MIDFGSGSSYEFLEFRKVPNPAHIFNLPTTGTVSANFIFHTKSYSTHSAEFAGIKLEIKFLFICSFTF